jgi:lipase chaperone LimK
VYYINDDIISHIIPSHVHASHSTVQLYFRVFSSSNSMIAKNYNVNNLNVEEFMIQSNLDRQEFEMKMEQMTLLLKSSKKQVERLQVQLSHRDEVSTVVFCYIQNVSIFKCHVVSIDCRSFEI